jgi:hypothetical protein
MPPNLERYEYMGIGIMGGAAHMLASIVRILEEKGLVGPGEFADVLEQAIGNLDKEPSPFPPGIQRYDALLMGRVAKVLRNQKNKGWKPVVIQGGLADEENK